MDSAEVAEREERVEWRVESDTTEDEFDIDEQGARYWLAQCQANPEWEPAVLMSRTVVTERSAWKETP